MPAAYLLWFSSLVGVTLFFLPMKCSPCIARCLPDLEDDYSNKIKVPASFVRLSY